MMPIPKKQHNISHHILSHHSGPRGWKGDCKSVIFPCIHELYCVMDPVEDTGNPCLEIDRLGFARQDLLWRGSAHLLDALPAGDVPDQKDMHG